MARWRADRTWLVYRGAESFAMALGWTLAPVYFVQEVGMDPLQLVLAGTFMEVAYFLFEVPTGVVADTYSRRLSVVVAQLVMGAAFVVTGLFADVGIILVAAALTGFGWTFKSGAIDAWLADEVGPERLAREYQRGAQVARVFALLGIGAAVGLALVELSLPVVAGGVVMLGLGVLLAVAMPETGFRPASREEVGAVRSMASTARAGGRLMRVRPILLLILGITFFSGMWSESVDRLWEAHFLVDVGVPDFAGFDPIVWFGVLNAGAILLAIAVAQPLSRRFARAGWRGMTKSLLWLDAAMLLGTVAFAFAGSFGAAVLAYWAIRVAASLAAPVYSTWINANIEDSSVRATVISMTNLGDSAGEWGGGPALGLVGNAFGIRAALAAGAAVLAPALALYAVALRRGDEALELDVAAPVPQPET
jgi:DHA3 family tetracycline resistance protein-like MFS transporter